jgi:hypothetical protein
MRIKPNVKAVDVLLAEILASDDVQSNARRRTFPREVAEAVRYYMVWGKANTRLEALIKLAAPLSIDVVNRVERIGRETDAETASQKVRQRGRR